ncbi:hypothetical protein L198_07384 [Cryptococcus wingfieldii CBS 7118]|uniref:Uncharacterized protein n=1 Tax=Cryptococcus wingfieldii CBS 7118 TaxID=1295528 RepID=A0A1E3IEB3_9TREE|nr:hypothetical protein L198_07384 [Cryptococcus wingfieldii CBS 7118]ODN86091.1 hypothetical protein L198_07384 [Cryptococcus wingfieldii CBS 7118]
MEEQSSPSEDGSSSSPGLDAGASSSDAPPSTRQDSFNTFMKSIQTQFTKLKSSKSAGSSSAEPEVMELVPEEEREPVSLYSERALEEAIDDVTREIQENLAYQRLGQACLVDPATRNALPSIEHVYTAYRDIMDNATLHDTIHSFVSEKMELERNLALEAVNQGEIGDLGFAYCFHPDVDTTPGSWGLNMSISPGWGGNNLVHIAPVEGIKFGNEEVRSWFAEGEKSVMAETGKRLATEGTELVSNMKRYPDPRVSPMFEWDTMDERIEQYDWHGIGKSIKETLAGTIDETIAANGEQRREGGFSGQGEQRNIWLQPITALTEDGLSASLRWSSKDGFFDGTGKPDEIDIGSLVEGGLEAWRDIKGKKMVRD